MRRSSAVAPVESLLRAFLLRRQHEVEASQDGDQILALCCIVLYSNYLMTPLAMKVLDMNRNEKGDIAAKLRVDETKDEACS